MKNLEYYLSLNYPIEVLTIPTDEGGGFYVCIPQLGRKAFQADGETIEEALNNLQALKEESFARMLENGIPIPEPIQETDEEYSGKFLVRVPKELHRAIVYNAKKNNSSLNQYIQYIITVGLGTSSFGEVVEFYCGKFEKIITEMKSVEYVIDQKKLYQEYQSPHLHLLTNERGEKYSDYLKVG
jgi:predicted HicB family RNase H-like nuclease